MPDERLYALIERRLDELAQRIDALGGQVQQLIISEERAAAVRADQADERAEMRRLPQRVDRLTERVERVEGDVLQLQARVEAVAELERGRRSTVREVMDHPRFPWVVGAMVIGPALLAGTVSLADLRAWVPMSIEATAPRPADVRSEGTAADRDDRPAPPADPAERAAPPGDP